MQPGSQKEMQIDFDDDESPKQAQQSRAASRAVTNSQVQSHFTEPNQGLFVTWCLAHCIYLVS